MSETRTISVPLLPSTLTKFRVLDIRGVPIEFAVSKSGDELVTFLAPAMIDNDGIGGNPDQDPFHQDTTSLKRDGKSLNAYEESFIVVPPVICQRTRGIVLGSLCLVENTIFQEMCFAVVGDLGPADKVGEMSPACAQQVGVDPDPVTGGESSRIIRYTIFVNQAANIGGIQYALQRYRSQYG